MANPRKCSVEISVGDSPLVDITQDLVSFTFEENIKEAGVILDIELDDSSKYYRNSGLQKGQTVSATITTTDWRFPGDYQSRSTGICFIDTIELEAKPATFIIKATSINPTMLNDEVASAGYEGQSVQDSINDVYGLQNTMDGLTGGEASDSDNAGAITTDNNRMDQDNQGNLKWRRAQAQAVGCEVVVVNNKITTINEQQMEAKPATKTLSAQSPIIRGNFHTNSVGKFVSSQVTHMDIKTGQVSTGEFVPAQPPSGTLSVYKSRKRSLQPGQNDNYPAAPGTAVDKGEPGDPFSGEA